VAGAPFTASGGWGEITHLPRPRRSPPLTVLVCEFSGGERGARHRESLGRRRRGPDPTRHAQVGCPQIRSSSSSISSRLASTWPRHGCGPGGHTQVGSPPGRPCKTRVPHPGPRAKLGKPRGLVAHPRHKHVGRAYLRVARERVAFSREMHGRRRLAEASRASPAAASPAAARGQLRAGPRTRVTMLRPHRRPRGRGQAHLSRDSCGRRRGFPTYARAPAQWAGGRRS
jgi:hypothetical protein